MKKLVLASTTILVIGAGCNSISQTQRNQRGDTGQDQLSTSSVTTIILDDLKFSFDNHWHLSKVNLWKGIYSEAQYVNVTTPGQPYNSTWTVSVEKLPAAHNADNASLIIPENILFKIPRAIVYSAACSGYCHDYILVYGDGAQYFVDFTRTLDLPASDCRNEDCQSSDRPSEIDSQAIMNLILPVR